MIVRKMPLFVKPKLVIRIWIWHFIVIVAMRVRPLPNLIDRLSISRASEPGIYAPARLGRVVHRVLRVPPLYEARCIVKSLVLFRLLIKQGVPSEIVIGLVQEPSSHNAHSWIEVNGRDVGPPPGRAGHAEIARYGPSGG